MAAVLVHRSPLAGTWYPGDPNQLSRLLDQVLQISVERAGCFVRRGGLAFIVPHAAPSYSGVVASSVYRHLQAAGATRIVILGFSHRRLHQGIAIPDVHQIATPLGAMQVDSGTARALAACPPFELVPDEAACDHSVEVQIPYLQTLLPEASILPLYVGKLNGEQRLAAAEMLRELMDSETVLIASSDLTHYGPDFRYLPFELDESTGDRLRNLDMRVLAAAGSLDPVLFGELLRKTGATVCGAAPIQLLLETIRELPGEIFQETLDYETSGELTHNYENSVSYGAIGYFAETAFQLEPGARKALLAAARFTLDLYRRTGEHRLPDMPSDPSLTQRCRAFVTLYSNGCVRGCIGRFEDPLVLAEGVPRLAIDASQDVRFGPLCAAEQVEIEVHILTPPKRIRDPRQIKLGEHGAYLKAGNRGGLLLPGVVERHGLSQSRFLEELARKAGLPDSIYTAGGFELDIFRAQSFQESRI